MSESVTPDRPSEPALDLVVELRRRWQGGDRVPVEVLLQQYAALSGDAELLLDLVYNEFLLREEAGDQVVVEDYYRRFPQLAGPLRLLFEADEALAPYLREPDSRTPLSD